MTKPHTILLCEKETDHGPQLCQVCKSLGLSVDKFLIASSDLARSVGLRPTAARSRDQPEFMGIDAPSGLQLNSGFGQKSLGTLSQIKRRCTEQGCPLCKLVWTAIERYSAKAAVKSEKNNASNAGAGSGSNLAQGISSGSEFGQPEEKNDEPDVNLSSECSMVWEVDGRQARGRRTGTTSGEEEDIQYSNVSRRIRFWWEQRDEKVQESYILFVPPPDPMVPNADGSGYQRGKWAKAEFLARDFDPEKSQYALIGSWLDICDKHEPKCTEVYEPDRFEILRNQTWFGVIDVVQMRLCRLPESRGPGKELYVALSYVWGPIPDPDHRTLRENVNQRTYPGGIEERRLPKTIRQAIQLTRDLGLRYIWVDSLCIVQDSYSSFKLNAEQMDLIYRNAHLTICAADGDDAGEGLSALDPMKAEKPIAQHVEGITLQVSRPSESVIRDSVWDQRGWTFQERILSPRCLVFVKGRFYFQCRKSNMSQDIYPDPTGNGLSMDWMNSPLRTLSGLKTRPIWFYMTCVSLYTGRHLTNAEDILPAFEGVAGLMRTRMHGDLAKFLYGLPPSHFDLALLWEPLRAQKRRKPSKKPKYKQVDMELPSWSWAGWTDASIEDSPDAESDSSAGEQSKDSYSDKGSQVKYKSETLDGCFADVHEWLMQHTWIQWFIRNNSGDLRPIWDKQAMSEVKDVLPRWRGYAVGDDERTEHVVQDHTPSIGFIEYGPSPNGPRYAPNSNDENLPYSSDGYSRRYGEARYQQEPENFGEARLAGDALAAGERELQLLRQIVNLQRELVCMP